MLNARSWLCFRTGVPLVSTAFGSALCASRKLPSDPCPLCAAMVRALTPAAEVSLTSAPASSKRRADSRSPCWAANSSGVKPPYGMVWMPGCSGTLNTIIRLPTNERLGSDAIVAYTLAPASSSAATISDCRCATAHINAVCPLDVSLASTPRSSRVRAASPLPSRTASMRRRSVSAAVAMAAQTPTTPPPDPLDSESPAPTGRNWSTGTRRSPPPPPGTAARRRQR